MQGFCVGPPAASGLVFPRRSPARLTPERFHKLRRVLERRQPDLTVVLDDVHKPHNLAAIVRSCDAVGVGTVHAVTADARVRLTQKAAGGSGKWVRVRSHPRVEDVIAELHACGLRVLVAHTGSGSTDFRRVDFTLPTAVVFGGELRGASAAARRGADGLVHVPMVGMVESLNVSVAAAVVLFEAARQREAARLYERPHLGADELSRTLFEWAYPRLAAWYRRRNLPYPPLDADGGIDDSAHTVAG